MRMFPKIVAHMAFAVCAFVMPSVAAESPAFVKAVPVWPKGQEKGMNLFYGFRASFDLEKSAKMLLRVTGCSDYRITLNGRHIGWGPARATRGYFRVDELPFTARNGRIPITSTVFPR